MMTVNRLFRFLEQSPVNFLACAAVAARLEEAGYVRLDARNPLPSCKPGDRFYTTKNDSSIYAFCIGSKPLAEAGFHVICAHCDSPTFRIKPNPEIRAEKKIIKLNVEMYGGVILSSWFDRPLSIAGRVILKGADSLHPVTKLLHIDRPLLTIPNLCIHFNRQVNDGVKISVQKDMQPIFALITRELETESALNRILCNELGVNEEDILDFDLYLYETTKPCLLGANNEFISAGRLDDLEMVCAGLEALISHADTPETTRVLAVFDNEETGSHTKQGAASPFFANFIQRLVLAQGGNAEDYYRSVEHSFMVSADNAHAWHPNYGEKSDPINHPMLGGGPVVKFNAAQKYASDAVSAAVFASICKDAGVPCQRFVNHSDVAGGSTLGNILTATMPIHGVDMGNAILAMHSVRELGSVADYDYCLKAFTEFYK